jgi:hypothetical protein
VKGVFGGRCGLPNPDRFRLNREPARPHALGGANGAQRSGGEPRPSTGAGFVWIRLDLGRGPAPVGSYSNGCR